MSGSAKPSPGSGRPAPVEFALPSGMFFEGLDYNPKNVATRSLMDSQQRVVRHRGARKADIHQQLDDLARLNSAAHAADRQGNLAAHWDSVVSAAAKLFDLISTVSKQIDSAEARYEEALFETARPTTESVTPHIPPAGAVPPPAPAGVPSPVHLVMTSKPEPVQRPQVAVLASKVRRAP